MPIFSTPIFGGAKLEGDMASFTEVGLFSARDGGGGQVLKDPVLCWPVRPGETFIGPTAIGGWSSRLTPDLPSVHLFVVFLENYEFLVIMIFPKLGMKFKDNNGHRLTKLDFMGKIFVHEHLSK